LFGHRVQKRIVGDSDEEMDDEAAQDSFAEDDDDSDAPARKTAPATRRAAAPAKQPAVKGKGKGKEQSLVSPPSPSGERDSLRHVDLTRGHSSMTTTTTSQTC
jgi:hypothetical protein